MLGKPSGQHASGILVREQENMLLFQRLLAVCHLFQGNKRLQEINQVENTHRDNDGKSQQRLNVRLKWKPR